VRALLRAMRRSLRVKTALLLVVAALLPVGLLAMDVLRAERRQLTKAIESLLAARADELTRMIDDFNEQFRRSSERLAAMPEIASLSASGQPAAAAAILKVWQRSDPDVSGLALLDERGVVSLSTEPSLAGKSLWFRSWVRDGSQGKCVISDVYLEPSIAGSDPTIAYAAPVHDARGAVVGMVAEWVRAAALWRAIKTTNALAGPGSYAAILDRYGIRIGHSLRDDVVFHPSAPLDGEARRTMVAEHRFGERTRTLVEDVWPFPEMSVQVRLPNPRGDVFRGFGYLNGAWDYVVARRTKTAPWTVFYLSPQSGVDAQVASVAKTSGLFALGILVSALLLGTLLGGMILEPIRALARATAAVAAGALTVRVPVVARSDELGRLGHNFNAMVKWLGAQADAVARSREELAQKAAIVESSGDAIIGKSLTGVITSWNAAATRLFGYTANEIVGKPVTTLIPAERRHEEPEMLARLSRGERFEQFDTVRLRKDGRRIDVSLTSSPVRDADGRLVGASKIVRDITERRRAQTELAAARDQAEAASRELEAFSYSVAHDLRAPLRAMGAYAHDLQAQRDRLDEEGRDSLQEIVANTRKMSDLIDGLLSLSRVTRTDLMKETVDLSALAREVVAELRAGDPGRRAVVRIQEGLMGDADPRLIRALLDNLLGNAWKFTSRLAEAHLEFGARDDGGERTFFVRDDGAGFDMAHADKLFTAFQRLHKVRDFPGTGIGLATSQRIVRRHGGRIWAEASPGQGATFYFTLPAPVGAES